ncbi:MAG: hypothetical protein K0B06_10625 [Brevefilum sp.]|nr:hypothetical protein [Brevefilum sp.]
MAKKKADKKPVPLERKPWIEKAKGLRIITIVSLGLALWVGYQILRTGNDWGRAILWGAIFGGSTWLVYFGMIAFHSLFNPEKKDQND